MKKNIFFHLGTERTGTTYLQDKIFPLFKNITYIHKKQFKQHRELIANSKHTNILISFEFGRSFEADVAAFSKNFPDAIPIIVFRKHSEYIISQYKRYLKNGHKLAFDDFFHPYKESYFDNNELRYRKLVEVLEIHFTSKPLILLYENLVNNPQSLFGEISKRIGGDLLLPKRLPKPIHVSYSERQLKFLLDFFNSYTNRKKVVYTNKFVRYAILYLAKLLPEKKSRLIPLVSPELIDSYFEKDWEYCTRNNISANNS